MHSEARRQSIRDGAPVPPPPRIALHGPHRTEPPRSASDHVVQIAPPPIMEARIAPSRTVQPWAMLPWTTPHRNVALLACRWRPAVWAPCVVVVLVVRLACMCTTEPPRIAPHRSRHLGLWSLGSRHLTPCYLVPRRLKPAIAGVSLEICYLGSLCGCSMCTTFYDHISESKVI